MHCGHDDPLLAAGRLGPFDAGGSTVRRAAFFAVSGKYLILQWETGKADNTKLRGILKKRIHRTCFTTLLVVVIHTVYSLVWHLTRGESLGVWLRMKYAPAEWQRLLLFNTGGVISDGSVQFEPSPLSSIVSILEVLYPP